MFNKESVRLYFKYDLKIMYALIVIYYFLNFFYVKGGLKLEVDFFNYFLDNIICYIENLENRKIYQQLLVNDLLRIIKWNEFCFNINPNCINFQLSKLSYEWDLKHFLGKLNLDAFDDPNEALRFITEFSDHYLKVIEHNHEEIKNIDINAQYSKNYNTLCVILFRIIFFIISIRFIFYIFVTLTK